MQLRLFTPVAALDARLDLPVTRVHTLLSQGTRVPQL